MWSWFRWLVWTWWVRALVRAREAPCGASACGEAPAVQAAPASGPEQEPAEASEPEPAAPVGAQVPVERAVRVYLQKHRLGIQMTGLEGVDASGLQRPPQELWFMNSAN